MTKFCVLVDTQDEITCATFGGDRLRGLGVAKGRISRFPIDLRRRPYNTLTLTCECVTGHCLTGHCEINVTLLFTRPCLYILFMASLQLVVVVVVVVEYLYSASRSASNALIVP